MLRSLRTALVVVAIPALSLGAQSAERLLQPAAGDDPIPMGTTKGERFSRLVIRNATVISGRGTPGNVNST